MKGAFAPKAFAHPSRILYPLKRVGERGSGEWQQVSWDQAMDEIAEKLKAVVDKYGPEAFALGFSGATGMSGQRPFAPLHEPPWLAQLDKRCSLLHGQYGCRESHGLWLVSTHRHSQLELHRAVRPRSAPPQLDDGIQVDPHGAGARCQADRARSAAQ